MGVECSLYILTLRTILVEVIRSNETGIDSPGYSDSIAFILEFGLDDGLVLMHLEAEDLCLEWGRSLQWEQVRICLEEHMR